MNFLFSLNIFKENITSLLDKIHYIGVWYLHAVWASHPWPPRFLTLKGLRYRFSFFFKSSRGRVSLQSPPFVTCHFGRKTVLPWRWSPETRAATSYRIIPPKKIHYFPKIKIGLLSAYAGHAGRRPVHVWRWRGRRGLRSGCGGGVRGGCRPAA